MWNVAFVAVALVLVSSVGAVAADFCTESGSGGSVLVAKAFVLPGKGVCKQLRGFLQENGHPVFGQACGSSDNHRIAFSLTFMAGTAVGTFQFLLNRVTLTGSGELCDFDVFTGARSCDAVPTIAKIPCSPPTVPVP